ncbi:MAG: ATP synthase F1 subunit gamma [Oscillospiraceae bacterium]|nr:ATP synthase F1 subunit gamma [Oscillospiraceae bacterium]
MAGTSMKSIKLRIKSVESTMQITKAMELVASSKLRRAKERMEKSRPYFTLMHGALAKIAAANTDFSSVYVTRREVKKTCYVIIAGDRGLAGGYNANIFKQTAAHMENKTVCALPIGKKALEYCDRHHIEVLSREFACAEDMTVRRCNEAAFILTAGFREGQYDELYICYTNFVSMLSQQPAVMRVLPISYTKAETKEGGPHGLVLYEPSSEAVYDAIVPSYVSGMVYGALCESVASEQGARRTAMDAASKNAGDMIEDLNLRYNRSRQGAITQEITEIVAGAEQ